MSFPHPHNNSNNPIGGTSINNSSGRFSPQQQHSSAEETVDDDDDDDVSMTMAAGGAHTNARTTAVNPQQQQQQAAAPSPTAPVVVAAAALAAAAAVAHAGPAGAAAVPSGNESDTSSFDVETNDSFANLAMAAVKLMKRTARQYGAGGFKNSNPENMLQYAWELAPRGRMFRLEEEEGKGEEVVSSSPPPSSSVAVLAPLRASLVNVPSTAAIRAASSSAVDAAISVSGSHKNKQEQHAAAAAAAAAAGDDSDDDDDGGVGRDDHDVKMPLMMRNSSRSGAGTAVGLSVADLASIVGGEDDDELVERDDELQDIHDAEADQLDELRATAIAGNDLTSSCLYAAGVTIRAGGVIAPFSTLLVVAVLYVFRSVYGEVGTALPMNGGTYNALLNTATKKIAALAALLSLISYAATATCSAASAAAYANYQWDAVPVLGGAVTILVVFALLNLAGVNESANVATLLFLLHVSVCAVLIVAGFVFMCKDDFSILSENFKSYSSSSSSSSSSANVTTTTTTTTTPSPDEANTTMPTMTPATWAPSAWAEDASPRHNWFLDLFYGCLAGTVGISGFESASNYIEEQRPGVYVNVLRNLWFAVLLINPAIVLVTIGVLPIPAVFAASDYSLAKVAETVLGDGMRIVLVIDATLVLSGAVLTAYVGVGGLMRRMSLDKILPRFFLARNRCCGTYHVVILSFCALCCLLRWCCELTILTGVYSTAFLAVMCLFAVACLILKQKRNTLYRTVVASPITVSIAFLCMFVGFIGNFTKFSSVVWFLLFFISGAIILSAFMMRATILKYLAIALQHKWPLAANWCRDVVVSMRRARVAFFAISPEISHLNKILHYIQENEDASRVYIVYCAERTPDETQALDAQFETSCATLDMIFPRMTVNCVRVQRAFDQTAVDRVAKALHVSRNMCFIACPKSKFFPQFAGLRIITHYTKKYW